MSGWPRPAAASMTWRPACACSTATSGRTSAGTLMRFDRSRRTPRQRLAALPTRSASGSRVCDRGWTWPSGPSTPTWQRIASHFTAAVEAELHGWDAFAERLQATAAAKTGSARDRAETGIKELRRRRLAVTERLDDLRDAPERPGGSTKSASPPRAMSWNGWRTTCRHHSSKGGNTHEPVTHTTNRIRWTIGINGALSVAFGAMILAWPGIRLYALTILFGAYALAAESSASSTPPASRRDAAGRPCRACSASASGLPSWRGRASPLSGCCMSSRPTRSRSA